MMYLWPLPPKLPLLHGGPTLDIKEKGTLVPGENKIEDLLYVSSTYRNLLFVGNHINTRIFFALLATIE